MVPVADMPMTPKVRMALRTVRMVCVDGDDMICVRLMVRKKASQSVYGGENCYCGLNVRAPRNVSPGELLKTCRAFERVPF